MAVSNGSWIGLDTIQFERTYNTIFPFNVGTIISDFYLQFRTIIDKTSQHMAAPIAVEKAEDWISDMRKFLSKVSNGFVSMFCELQTAGKLWSERTKQPISLPSKTSFVQESVSERIINYVKKDMNGVVGADLDFFKKEFARLVLGDDFGVKNKINKLLKDCDELGFVGGQQLANIKSALNNMLSNYSTLQKNLLEKIFGDAQSISNQFGDTAGRISYEFNHLLDSDLGG